MTLCRFVRVFFFFPPLLHWKLFPAFNNKWCSGIAEKIQIRLHPELSNYWNTHVVFASPRPQSAAHLRTLYFWPAPTAREGQCQNRGRMWKMSCPIGSEMETDAAPQEIPSPLVWNEGDGVELQWTDLHAWRVLVARKVLNGARSNEKHSEHLNQRLVQSTLRCTAADVCTSLYSHEARYKHIVSKLFKWWCSWSFFLNLPFRLI